jgi:putative Holliday junction resolvase
VNGSAPGVPPPSLPRRRLLGVDLGDRRLGVAIGDPETGEVRPLATLRRAPRPVDDARRLARLAAEQGAGAVVVGLPLEADGREGHQAERTRRWVEAVAPALALPIRLVDERWSTERAMERVGRLRRGPSGGPPGPSRRRGFRARLDREAAAVIVAEALEGRATDWAPNGQGPLAGPAEGGGDGSPGLPSKGEVDRREGAR